MTKGGGGGEGRWVELRDCPIAPLLLLLLRPCRLNSTSTHPHVCVRVPCCLVLPQVGDKNQSVYIYGCGAAIIDVRGKGKSVTLDSCKRTQVREGGGPGHRALSSHPRPRVVLRLTQAFVSLGGKTNKHRCWWTTCSPPSRSSTASASRSRQVACFPRTWAAAWARMDAYGYPGGHGPTLSPARLSLTA